MYSVTTMVKNHIVTIRLDDEEYEMVKELSNATGASISEVFRRLLWTTRILFSDYLPLREAFISATLDHEPTLAELLKPLPELMRIVIREKKKRAQEQKLKT